MGLKRPTGESLAQQLGERIGHVFTDLRLLETALTHSSAVKAKANNERLEFLGDRILGLVVADLLYRQYPDLPEGGLAPRFNALVDTQTCAEVAAELELDGLIRSDSALKANKLGAARNYLSDAVEALIAAIYLDGGMEAATRFVLRYWEPRSRSVVAMPRNPKSELQEWAVQFDGARPEYVIDGRTGPDHQPVFTVSVRVAGRAAATASGPSRRAAEEAAAIALMTREGVWNRKDIAS